MPTTRSRRRIRSVPADLTRAIGKPTSRLLEQIYDDHHAQYSKVKKALDGIGRAIVHDGMLDCKRAESLIVRFNKFSIDVAKTSNRITVLNHIITGTILNLVDKSKAFATKQAFMRWARMQFAHGRSDQSLLNSRHIADLGEIAVEYADCGVKAVLELHYLFKTVLEQQVGAGQSPKERQAHLVIFKAKLDRFRGMVENYHNSRDAASMRVAMDAAITHFRLVECAGIPESTVTPDHSIMIALYKGFSLEQRDADKVKLEISKRSTPQEGPEVVFDKWVANRMTFAPSTFEELEHTFLPKRLLDALVKLSAVPSRGSRHLLGELAEMKRETPWTKNVVHQVHWVLAFVSYKLGISLDSNRTAIRECIAQLRIADEEGGME